MKAARMHSYGGPEVLRYEEVPDPSIQPDEVLLRVRACALNHLDLWVRRGLPGLSPAMPHILGSDIAGEVVACGGLCRRIKPQQRVLVAPGWSCRQCEACLSGRDNECRQYAIWGAALPGGNREWMAAPEWALIPIPDELPFEEAAAAPLVFLTAWHMLMVRARLQPGEDVLVIAASSGVGSAAVQIAKLFQCRVIATAGGEEKLAKTKALGADQVIDHYGQDIAAEVKRFTEGRGVDVVFEHAGSATWPKSLASLAAGGRLVTCGATTGHEVNIDLRHLFVKRQTVAGSFMGALGDLYQVLKFVFRGRLRAVVDSVYPLEEIRAAHERLERREHFGKVVLRI
jgi:NADPH:quinone reductase-like Zn-dependent oxidoreductase